MHNRNTCSSIASCDKKEDMILMNKYKKGRFVSERVPGGYLASCTEFDIERVNIGYLASCTEFDIERVILGYLASCTEFDIERVNIGKS